MNSKSALGWLFGAITYDLMINKDSNKCFILTKVDRRMIHPEQNFRPEEDLLVI
jgi:hypothetical protein